MAIKLNHISQFLLLIKKFETSENTKPIIRYIKKSFNDILVSGTTYPDYDLTSNFTINSGLVISNDEIFKITELGNIIIQNLDSENNFNFKSKEIFIKNCLLKGHYSHFVQKGLSKFIKNLEEIWAPTNQVFDLFSEKKIIPILYESDLLLLLEDKVILNPKFSYKIKLDHKKQVKISQKFIDKQLDHYRVIGEIAEEIALNYEKNRLEKISCQFEAKNVQQISSNYANAGFDLLSYDGKTTNGEHNRFIEVKGTTDKEFAFNWSKNEMKKAELLGDKYWIYFIDQIDIVLRNSPNEPTRIQNPHKNIIQNSYYNKICDTYHITRSSHDP